MKSKFHTLAFVTPSRRLNIRCFDLGVFAEPLRDRGRENALLLARQTGLEIQYLERKGLRKEELVAEILEKRGRHPGRVHIFSASPTGNHNTLERKVRREFGGWIQDGLRHSFGTYYHNHPHDIAHVVYVMGNSIKIAKKHYVREVTKKWKDKFWSLKPTA